MDQPFIICGLGRIGWRILEYLQAGSFPVVVIDTNCSADDPRLGRATLVRGDCRRQEILIQAGVRGSRGVIVVTSDDLVNISTALAIRNLNADVRIVVRMINENLIARLGKAVANVFALSVATLVGPVLALTALSGQALGTFRVDGTEEGTFQVSEVTVQQRSAWPNRTIAELAAEQRVVVLAHFPATVKARLLHEVIPESILAGGDRLIVCGKPRDLTPLLTEAEEQVPPHVLWASFLRRNWRMLGRTLREVDLAVKITSAVLVGVIALSTLILHLAGGRNTEGGNLEISITDAFFRSISLMATGAAMRGEDYWPWEKVFAGLLRIAGAATFAAFTAIVTNYLLRAHLGGAFEIRRIPDSGHIVVCGLGNIGFRVVRELKGSDQSVVVVERAGDNPFISTVRGLGVPVILGDATVASVLEQAHSATARAVIAATTNDLVNLEIALLVRETNPQQRVVPCLADAHLAQSIREAANVRLNLSIPTLAAPSFVASLFGDKVQSVFMLQGRLLAAVDLTIQPLDTWLSGQYVRSVAIDYHLVPAAVFAADGTALPQPLEARLEAGWRLVGILALPDLERLFRRESAPRSWTVHVDNLPADKRGLVMKLAVATGAADLPDDQETPGRPMVVGKTLTRGQAEQLRVLLGREGVMSEVRGENQ
jgi:Trk K+ transport system NAD-binding subunit